MGGGAGEHLTDERLNKQALNSTPSGAGRRWPTILVDPFYFHNSVHPFEFHEKHSSRLSEKYIWMCTRRMEEEAVRT